MKISVVTINLNNSEGLYRTLSSVYRQTYSDLEMIVIDAGSTDGSIDCVKHFSSRIGYFVSEKDKGIYDGQNKGWLKAEGDYVLFLNSGDVLLSDDVLEKMLTLEPKEDIIYGDMIVVSEDQREHHYSMPDRVGIFHMYRDTVWHPVSLIRRTLLQKIGGYDIRFKIAADYDFFCHAILHLSCTHRHISLPLSKFYSGGVSSSESTSSLLLKERRIIQDKWLPRGLLVLFRLYSKLRS